MLQNGFFMTGKLFPAYAGVIPGCGPIGCLSISLPRIRGGDPCLYPQYLTV